MKLRCLRRHESRRASGAASARSAGLALLLIGAAPAAAQQDVELTWLSFAQLTAEHANGADGLRYGTDRVRAKLEATYGRVTGGGVLDFGAGDLGDAPPGTLANVVADLYVNYRVGESHLLRGGQFKTPFGMDFNMPGHDLDVAKRGMEAGLVFNRDLGIMLSGQGSGTGFGYDVGVFNPAGRSGATRYLTSQLGQENAVIGRVRYDGTQWHTELAYGETGAAGGPGTADYEATDVGFRYETAQWDAKVEWVEGRGVYGDADRTESVYYVHGAYVLSPKIELVARSYRGQSAVSGAATRLTNTLVGVNFGVFATPRMNGRLQANYVAAGADKILYTGVSGYRDDTLLIQFQLYAEQ